MSAIDCSAPVSSHRSLTLLLSSWLLLGLLRATGLAQITLDGSLGRNGPLPGPHYTIPAEVGQLRGPNLFHSFGKFNVQTGESATFTGPNTIQNIVGRVTGGTLSTIDGVLTSEIPGANLFLLNPRGVLFGPNARLNVSGSLHVSTADYLRLADGAIFHTDLTAPSLLSVAPPAAFGFLAPSPASIAVQESFLEVAEGRSLSLVGGDVRIIGGPSGFLRARGGRVNVVSVASAGEATFDPATQTPDTAPGSFARLGSIDLSSQAFLSATGSPDGTGSGGTIVIRGGRLMMTGDSVLGSNTLGNADGAPVGIDVRVAGDAVVDSSFIQTIGVGAGRAGDVVISASTVTIQNDGGLGTDTLGAGSGGNLTLDVGRLTVTGGGAVGTNTAADGAGGALTIRASDAVVVSGRGTSGISRLFSFTDGIGPGGSVTVSALALSIDGGILLARTSAAGNAGNVLVEVDRLNLTGVGSIGTGEGTLSGFSSGAGRAGSVTVNARESVSLAQGSIMNSMVGASARGTPGRVLVTTPVLQIDDSILGGLNLSGATAGDVEVRASTVLLTTGGQITAEAGAGGTGGGGTVSIVGVDPRQPADLVSLSGSGRGGSSGSSGISTLTIGSGDAGHVSVAAHRLQVDGGTITSNTFGAGRGGDVELQVGTMTLTGRAFLSSSTGEEATGRGGSVTVTASDAASVVGSFVGAFSFGSNDAGRVSITAPSLSVESGSRISTLASGGGRAGNVTVDVGKLSVRGATIDSATLSSGKGGDVTLRAQSLEISSGAQISANSSSTGKAGNITLVTDSVLMREHSTVTTGATQADGGNITVTARTLVRLRDSQITTAVGSGAGQGGNITIDPDFVILERSQLVADAFGGPGGNITVVAEAFLADTASRVSASSALATPGDINIQALTNVSGIVAPLPQRVEQAAALLPTRCAERRRGELQSSFILAGRDSIPLEPGHVWPSPLIEGASRKPAAVQQRQRRSSPSSGIDAETLSRWQRGPLPTVIHTTLDLECGTWSVPGLARPQGR
jgi:filamentous hemagglutinin family protein